MNSHGTLIERVIQAWLMASRSLAIEVVAPFTLKNQAEGIDCIAFLPHFGGPNGMIIGASMPPHFDTDRSLIEFARKAGLFYSFLNPELYATYDENRFKEALKDWGFFGSPDRCPSFLK